MQWGASWTRRTVLGPCQPLLSRCFEIRLNDIGDVSRSETMQIDRFLDFEDGDRGFIVQRGSHTRRLYQSLSYLITPWRGARLPLAVSKSPPSQRVIRDAATQGQQKWSYGSSRGARAPKRTTGAMVHGLLDGSTGSARTAWTELVAKK
jgi:hypothetical protein